MRDGEKKKEESLHVHEETAQQSWKIEEGEIEEKSSGEAGMSMCDFYKECGECSWVLGHSWV